MIDLLIGAFCFAPSVHFFAVRQKENIRWPEKVLVAVVFLLLFAVVASTFLGVNLSRRFVERDAVRYGEEALRRVFVDEDTAFLLEQASQAWKNNPYGNLGVTYPLTQKDMQLGPVESTRVTGVNLRSYYEYPASLRYEGVIAGEGFAACGVVLLRLQLHRTASEWRINGFEWQCPSTRPVP